MVDLYCIFLVALSYILGLFFNKYHVYYFFKHVFYYNMVSYMFFKVMIVRFCLIYVLYLVLIITEVPMTWSFDNHMIEKQNTKTDLLVLNHSKHFNFNT